MSAAADFGGNFADDFARASYFVAGIDTDIGKTYATGFLAAQLAKSGRKVVTQKLVETGAKGRSQDVLTHRAIMGSGLLPEDRPASGVALTAPTLFEYPASVHLASRLEGRRVDTQAWSAATAELARRYETVLIEGAGGLCVPIDDTGFLFIDYIAAQNYPVVLVSSGRLGSVNHTLLSLQALKQRGIVLHSLVYNCAQNSDPLIADDTERFLRAFLQKSDPKARFYRLPYLRLK